MADKGKCYIGRISNAGAQKVTAPVQTPEKQSKKVVKTGELRK